MTATVVGGYTARSKPTWIRILLFALLFLIAGLYLAVILDSNVPPDEFWFPVFLFLFPVWALLLRPRAPQVEVFTALFASLSVLFFEIWVGQLYIPGVPPWVDRLVEFLSQSLILLFPFTFVHFSLVFPAAGERDEKRIRRALFFIYVPLGVLLFLHALALPAGAFDSAYIIFPLGFLLGLAIFVRNYLYSLTATEKNRLRVMLIGCLAGGLPIILANLAGSHRLAGFALLLLPLFPFSLALAVLKEDFAEPAPMVQKVLRVSMIAAGGVGGFFLASLVLSLILDLPDWSLWLLSLAASLAMIVPLFRWSGFYIGAYFPLRLPGPYPNRTESPAAFEPISPNPYIVGNPVRTPDMFFGRMEDFQFIRTKLEGQRQGCVILLCGERRAGKTSILYQILNRRLGPDLLPVFLDMQELVVQNDREFVKAVAVRVARAVEEEVTAASSIAREVEDYLQLTVFFEQVMKALGYTRLLLLFDEYELIGEKVREGRLSVEAADHLNSVLEKHGRLNLVLTGSRPLDADPAFSRLLGKSFYREISFLALPDAVSLICSPLRGRASFDSQAISDLLLLTRGHPFFLQLLCQLLVELLNESRSTTVTGNLVADAVARVLDNPPPQLLYKWSGYSSGEKLVLAGLATLLKRPGSYLPADRLSRLILSLPENHRKDLDRVGIRIILEDLRRTGTLDRDQDRYGFTMDLLRRYVKTEHTVWSVLGEKAETNPRITRIHADSAD